MIISFGFATLCHILPQSPLLSLLDTQAQLLFFIPFVLFFSGPACLIHSPSISGCTVVWLMNTEPSALSTHPRRVGE